MDFTLSKATQFCLSIRGGPGNNSLTTYSIHPLKNYVPFNPLDFKPMLTKH